MLDDALKGIRESVVGARAVWLVGLDGMAVAGSVEPGHPAPDDLAAAFADLFRKVGTAGSDVGRASPRELIVGDEEGWVVLRLVNPEYALLGVLARDGSLGRLRYEFRKGSVALAPELAP